MTQENSTNKHKLFIDGKEILASSSGRITFPGNNQINTLNVKIENVDLQNDSLFNKKIELFLNQSGTDETTPIFRGFVKSFTHTDANTSIVAGDVRTVLTGKEGVKDTLSNSKNADGKSVGQYLYDIIKDKVNYDNTVIGLDMLRDSNPPVFMTGVRGENLDVYQTVLSVLKKSIDDDNFTNPLTSFIDVYEGASNSNITIVKDKLVSSTPSYVFSYRDGISSLSYKRRQPSNTVHYKGRVEKYTNRPSGQVSMSIADIKDVGESRNLALQEILISQQQKDDIRIMCTKAYDIAVGSIVQLDVSDDDVSGNHRVQGKTITFGKSMNCTLELNKKRVKVSDYINQ
tara:strand:+ start:1442 stop:2473 length:1032 start_codon:yes stop_codon:yes gene_type:complete